MNNEQSNGGCCTVCGYKWMEARPRYCPRCDFPTNHDTPDDGPRTPNEPLDRYAEAHVGDTGHEANAPRPRPPVRGALAQHIFDTLLESNRLYVEQLRRDKA